MATDARASVVGFVPSERRPGVDYQIVREADGSLSCECVAFSRSRDVPPSCKHVVVWQLEQLEPADALPVHTFTGRRVFPLRPANAELAIEDIAHALSHQCRFAGHVRTFYSTAQHSVLVSELCPAEDALYGLIHDASEAYFVDIPKPVKHLPFMATYRLAEAAMQARIQRRFGLRAGLPASVKSADETIAAVEARSLFQVTPAWALDVDVPANLTITEAWPPALAKAKFLACWSQLRRSTGGGSKQPNATRAE